MIIVCYCDVLCVYSFSVTRCVRLPLRIVYITRFIPTAPRRLPRARVVMISIVIYVVVVGAELQALFGVGTFAFSSVLDKQLA